MTSIRAIVLAAAMAVAATGAGATQLVTNGQFTTLSNGLGQIDHTTVATGWTSSNYNFVIAQADVGSNGESGFLELWDGTNYAPGDTGPCNGNTCTPVGNSWDGKAADDTGNFVAMDGAYETGPVTQLITGLHIGGKYDLSFNYAFGQQTGFEANTTQSLTETLGVGDQSFTSNTFHVPSHGFSGWQTYGTSFTANATSETLSFLASGSPAVPPFAMISNVSITTPEPGGWALMLIGVGLAGAIIRRRMAFAAKAA
jgi:MYXO-CTERM domain-containing protein